MTHISKKFAVDQKYILYPGNCFQLLKKIPDNFIDLTITSPPYFMGKEYDTSFDIEDFMQAHDAILPEIIRITKKGGSICWQVGYHVRKGAVIPLDFLVHDIMKNFAEIYLRNRIVWTYGHGLHAKKRFSGRHETILWYTKGRDYYFNLDGVRVPQKYPGKRYYKGDKKGEFSGNPLGKNPSDLWEIPNVKANHPEKTEHPCQFPVALVQRIVKALSPQGGWILDPYIGAGTTGIAAILEKRKLVGAEINRSYYKIAHNRCSQALKNEIQYRPIDKPICQPNPSQSVAIKPTNFKWC